MAHKKAAGTTKNGRDSGPQYLGIKLAEGAKAIVGAVLVRQRGTRILPGKNVGMGKDHTLFALRIGKVKYATTRKVGFNNKTQVKNIVHIS